MIVKILGVRKGKSKSGKDFCQYYGSKEFTDYDKENNDCEGVTVVSEFTYTDFNLHPGDIVDFKYEPGFEGRATLVDAVVIKVNSSSAGKEKGN